MSHCWWATWAISSQWLICNERFEQITHSHSFDLSEMNEWANEQIPSPEFTPLFIHALKNVTFYAHGQWAWNVQESQLRHCKQVTNFEFLKKSTHIITFFYQNFCYKQFFILCRLIKIIEFSPELIKCFLTWMEGLSWFSRLSPQRIEPIE